MIRQIAMNADRAVRRVRVLANALSHREAALRTYSTSGDSKTISIGDVSVTVTKPKHPELVPVKYLSESLPQTVLRHLRWIMQKDSLGQDVFLIGPPGPLRRSIAMMYLELTQREAEYVSLSRDTTETDIKQRREIRSGTAFYMDQCAVRAATEGRILILEGIEKAERNVLPVINNLLENREMQLDDGRFLMSATRYDLLLKEHTKEEMDAWKLVRVDDRFRVIALGLPIPRYQGNPLDPPLRSRFQARDINPLPFKDQLEILNHVSEKLPSERVSQMLSFATTMLTDESTTLGLPDFPIDNLASAIEIMNAVPLASSERLIHQLYPYTVMMGKEGKTAVDGALKTFNISHENKSSNSFISEIHRTAGGATVTLSVSGIENKIQVNTGSVEDTVMSKDFVSTTYHDQLLADMMMSHMLKDFCIIGPKGCGKSVLVKQFAELLGYHLEPIMLYQDMTSRDLLQQRSTTPSGDTMWRHSALVTAALEGSLAVLDGVHRINTGTFSSIHRLIHDRELSLFDGTKLVRHDRYDAIKEENKLSDEDMTSRGILRIHPSFRIVALAEPPQIGSTSQQWLTSDLLTMFLYHNMRPLSQKEELQVLSKMVPDVSKMKPLLNLAKSLRTSSDHGLLALSSSLSTRQLQRIARRLAMFPDETLHHVVNKACLERFLPRLARSTLEGVLKKEGILSEDKPLTPESLDRSITCEVHDGLLRIGNTTVPVYQPENKMKVPDVLFYENAQHLSVMEAMLKDFMLGEHLLLVGNQGVGKNKIVDRFLHLLNRPREYLQLHRDTTVQNLTLQPSVRDGIIVYEDSPLVRAVKSGNILVVDEADKAPTHVTCILKTLVESGEMHLSDGRRIVSEKSGLKPSANILVSHPDFRMIVLANRPGFPFLGNDFFGAMGDIFSAHAVDNPDVESEMSMLRQYGPDVPEPILRKLVASFGEMRDMADQGLIAYPYSTREVVNMVRHLQKYPNEGLANVVKNVFDFDAYNKEIQETIIETMHKHGIPIGANPANVTLGKDISLPKFEKTAVWNLRKQGSRRKTSLMSLPVEEKSLKIKGPVRMNQHTYAVDRVEARSTVFTEQEAYWTLPMSEANIVTDVVVTKACHRAPSEQKSDLIHIATANPISLYTMQPADMNVTVMDLYDIFPHMSSSYRPRVKLASLGFPLDQNVILHEEVTNIILDINTVTGELRRLETATLMEAATEKFTRTFRKQQGIFKMCADFAHSSEGLLVFYKQNGQTLDVLRMLEGTAHTVSLPLNVHSLSMPAQDRWLITEAESYRKYLLTCLPRGTEYFLHFIAEETQGKEAHAPEIVATEPLEDTLLSRTLGQQISSPNRVIVTPDTHATVAVGFPELESSIELYSSPRELPPVMSTSNRMSGSLNHLMGGPGSGSDSKVVYLPETGQVVRALQSWKVADDIYKDGQKPKDVTAFLEVADLANQRLRYVPVPRSPNASPYTSWLTSTAEVNVVMSGMSKDSLVTVDTSGCVRLWETSLAYLDRSIQHWRRMIGDGADQNLQVTIDKDATAEPTMPKHGKVDPTGDPHVGGNTWAGGTGGRDTAGLGGIGGPYRLDAGHNVHQVPDWQKEAVPDHVKEAARKMGEKAFKQRLKEIQMSEYDAEVYESYFSSVRSQVQSLRVILDSLQAKSKERQWLKHQSSGDLDDAKLIEGLTGEKSIYKRRGEKEPEMGTPQQKPKLLKLVLDVSGSMYRFNGYDNRLTREMEATLMVMEAFKDYENKFKYDIIGHSGESHKHGFLKRDKPPKNNKDRLNVLKTIHAHSQFCLSGDSTLQAAKYAVESIANEEADERFVIVMSDANLDRYGIRPSRFAEVLMANEDVNAFAIFIGSLGNQAAVLQKQMPSGHAFVCMDTKNLPQILQQIFTSTMLK